MRRTRNQPISQCIPCVCCNWVFVKLKQACELMLEFNKGGGHVRCHDRKAMRQHQRHAATIFHRSREGAENLDRVSRVDAAPIEPFLVRGRRDQRYLPAARARPLRQSRRRCGARSVGPFARPQSDGHRRRAYQRDAGGRPHPLAAHALGGRRGIRQGLPERADRLVGGVRASARGRAGRAAARWLGPRIGLSPLQRRHPRGPVFPVADGGEHFGQAPGPSGCPQGHMAARCRHRCPLST